MERRYRCALDYAGRTSDLHLHGNGDPLARLPRTPDRDGVATPVDTYSPTEQVQAELFKATGLADASHTLTIEVTGEKNPASQAAVIVVDAFEVTAPGTRHQDTDPAIAYGPNWT